MKPWEAALLVVVSLLGLVTIGPALIGRFGLWGIFAAELLLVGVPAFAALLARPDPGAVISPRGIAGGALVGAGAFWIVSLVETSLLERFLPLPPHLQEEVRQLVGVDAGAGRLLLDFLALALAPGLCEEALFRGVLLRSLLGHRFSPSLSILIAALGFGAFHLSYYKMLPATLVGLVLGVVCFRGRSLGAAVAAHTANNLCVIALVRLGRDRPLGLGSAAGLVAALGAIAAVVSGLALLQRREPPSAQLS